MYSKKFVYTISAILLIIGIVAMHQDAHAAQVAKATKALAQFNVEATTTVGQNHMMIQDAAYSDYDLQPTDFESSNPQDTMMHSWQLQAQPVGADEYQGTYENPQQTIWNTND